jgi:hypothetical protein
MSILTGKVSKAFTVRRKVLGCLSRDEGEREMGLRCAISGGKEGTFDGEEWRGRRGGGGRKEGREEYTS